MQVSHSTNADLTARVPIAKLRVDTGTIVVYPEGIGIGACIAASSTEWDRVIAEVRTCQVQLAAQELARTWERS